MKYIVQVADATHEVTILPGTPGPTVLLDGRPVSVDLHRLHGRVYSLLQGGASHCLLLSPAQAEGSGTAYRVDVGDASFPVTVKDERELAAESIGKLAGGGKSGVVKAVMPGVVTKLLVSEGDAVEVGRPLLIMEAMKMENEIKSPYAGTVTKLHVQAGKGVMQGEALATIG